MLRLQAKTLIFELINKKGKIKTIINYLNKIQMFITSSISIFIKFNLTSSKRFLFLY